MAATRIMTIAILGVANLCAQDCAVTVFVMNTPPMLSGYALYGAQMAVKDMFARIGVKIAWKWGKVPPMLVGDQCRGPIAIQFDRGEPTGPRGDVLAYATPYAASAAQIHVFPEVILVHNGTREDVALLAHVLAHEIGHVLERMDRHSASGIMQEHFSSQEIDRMSRGPLSFAAEDVELIHEGLESVHAK